MAFAHPGRGPRSAQSDLLVIPKRPATAPQLADVTVEGTGSKAQIFVSWAWEPEMTRGQVLEQRRASTTRRRSRAGSLMSEEAKDEPTSPFGKEASMTSDLNVDYFRVQWVPKDQAWESPAVKSRDTQGFAREFSIAENEIRATAKQSGHNPSNALEIAFRVSAANVDGVGPWSEPKSLVLEPTHQPAQASAPAPAAAPPPVAAPQSEQRQPANPTAPEARPETKVQTSAPQQQPQPKPKPVPQQPPGQPQPQPKVLAEHQPQSQAKPQQRIPPLGAEATSDSPAPQPSGSSGSPQVLQQPHLRHSVSAASSASLPLSPPPGGVPHSPGQRSYISPDSSESSPASSRAGREAGTPGASPMNPASEPPPSVTAAPSPVAPAQAHDSARAQAPPAAGQTFTGGNSIRTSTSAGRLHQPANGEARVQHGPPSTQSPVAPATGMKTSSSDPHLSSRGIDHQQQQPGAGEGPGASPGAPAPGPYARVFHGVVPSRPTTGPAPRAAAVPAGAWAPTAPGRGSPTPLGPGPVGPRPGMQPPGAVPSAGAEPSRTVSPVPAPYTYGGAGSYGMQGATGTTSTSPTGPGMGGAGRGGARQRRLRVGLRVPPNMAEPSAFGFQGAPRPVMYAGRPVRPASPFLSGGSPSGSQGSPPPDGPR